MRRRSNLRKDRSGSAALEFSFILWPFVALIFAMFDLGHYLVVQQSLGTLASEAARSMIIQCGSTHYGKLVSTCLNSYTPLTAAQQKQIAPMLFLGGASPAIHIHGISNIGVPGGSFVFVASLSTFPTVLPWWGHLVGSLSASTSVPY